MKEFIHSSARTINVQSFGSDRSRRVNTVWLQHGTAIDHPANFVILWKRYESFQQWIHMNKLFIFSFIFIFAVRKVINPLNPGTRRPSAVSEAF